MRKGFALGAVAAMSIGVPAFAADELTYTYLDVGFLHTSFDDVDIDGEGITLNGSYAFNNRFHGFASYTNQDFDAGLDVQSYQLGAGIRWPLLDSKWDIVGTGAYLNRDAGSRSSDSGVGAGLALRGLATERLELAAGVRYVNFEDGGEGTLFSLGARSSSMTCLRWRPTWVSMMAIGRTCWAPGSTSQPSNRKPD
jgi:hypothetical protein